MKRWLVLILLAVALSFNGLFASGCSNNAQTYALVGGVGGVVIGGIVGGAGGAIVGGCIGGGAGYVIGNEEDKGYVSNKNKANPPINLEYGKLKEKGGNLSGLEL